MKKLTSAALVALCAFVFTPLAFDAAEVENNASTATEEQNLVTPATLEGYTKSPIAKYNIPVDANSAAVIYGPFVTSDIGFTGIDSTASIEFDLEVLDAATTSDLSVQLTNNGSFEFADAVVTDGITGEVVDPSTYSFDAATGLFTVEGVTESVYIVTIPTTLVAINSADTQESVVGYTAESNEYAEADITLEDGTVVPHLAIQATLTETPIEEATTRTETTIVTQNIVSLRDFIAQGTIDFADADNKVVLDASGKGSTVVTITNNSDAPVLVNNTLASISLNGHTTSQYATAIGLDITGEDVQVLYPGESTTATVSVVLSDFKAENDEVVGALLLTIDPLVSSAYGYDVISNGTVQEMDLVAPAAAPTAATTTTPTSTSTDSGEVTVTDGPAIAETGLNYVTPIIVLAGVVAVLVVVRKNIK